MNNQANLFSRRDVSNAPRLIADRRRFRRVHLDFLGRFMRADKQEFPCRLYDISVGGGALFSAHTDLLTIGERLVAYFDQIGRLEGTVARKFDGGFGLLFQIGLHKREKLCGQLMLLINKAEMPTLDERRHPRMPTLSETAQLKLAEGIVIPCSVLDVSISGASLGTDARPAIGQEVLLGKLRARIARHHEAGIGLEFLDIQNPNALKRFLT